MQVVVGESSDYLGAIIAFWIMIMQPCLFVC